MKRVIDAELDHFREHLELMGEKSIAQVRSAMRAFADRDSELAGQVVNDDDQIDRLELAVDGEGERYLNSRTPVPQNLRLVLAGMRACHDLERVGDEATSIARRAAKLRDEPAFRPYIDIPGLARIALGMLRDAVDCFWEGDMEKAYDVLRRDADVDQLYAELYHQVYSHVVKRKSTAARGFELAFILKSLERIADHATNIAQQAVFVMSSEDIRHRRS